MPRENPKRKVRKTAYTEYDEDADAKTNGESVASASSGATAKPPTRRRKGRLSLLPTLAMDILFEVFIRLQPSDVLNIMYTSKGFRDLLAAPSSTFIWKAVRENLEGFPNCPPFLSEVEYAKLAFNPHCYRCGKRTPNSPQWEVLARFCNACLDNMLIPTYRLIEPTDPNTSYEDVLGLIIKKRQGRRRHYLDHFYCEPQVNRVRRHIQNLPEKSSQTWLADAKRDAPGIREHAKVCRDWESKVRERRQEHLAETKLKRRDDIQQRLSQLGFGPALNRVMGEFANHRLVKPGVGLTERIWNNIKPVLIPWIQEREAKRLARSALTAYKILHPDTFLPGIADFLASSDGLRILQDLGDVPVSEEIFGDIGVFMDNWRRTVTLQLAGLVVIATEEHDKSLDQVAHAAKLAKLDLATTVFICECKQYVIQYGHQKRMDEVQRAYMHYPWVMAHPCVSNEHLDSDSKLFSIKDLRYEPEVGARLIKPIIEACALPAETTRTSDMDALDPRLICLKCKHGDAKPTDNTAVYTWRSAIGHAIICPHKETGYLWHRLSDTAAKMAKAAESSIYETKVVGDAAREAAIIQWGCTQCRDSKYRYANNLEGVKSHIKEMHKGSEPAYYRYARCPPGLFEVTLPADQCDE
ncbi:hypothetical protein BD410DRAFT_767177 [Rickenella mellea]|uniref:F-box domain-containing protein n=1 Tax=Rickenella mellea TaxID=50990 RepID=A0A4Y7QB02_9AGAM|nr:hypothetical protein BD410DRAFT_767177 [Rickenella mellea]